MEIPTRAVQQPNGHTYCVTRYVPAEGWLLTTWTGFVSPNEAEIGALAALEPLRIGAVPYLLNDNSRIQGPWFDSVAWLQQVWAPQATRLGLRYVAHVAQPHTEADLALLLTRDPFESKFDLQVFTSVAEAEAWLRDCRRHDSRPTDASAAPTAQAA